jgi:hypothetical protein
LAAKDDGITPDMTDVVDDKNDDRSLLPVPFDIDTDVLDRCVLFVFAVDTCEFIDSVPDVDVCK